MSSREYDVVVVGAGTAGAYAAATAAEAGLSTVVLERKSAEETGHIACGDALKGADAFPDAIPRSSIEPSFTNTGVDHGRFEIPREDTVLEIPVPGELAVIDRHDFGQRVVDGATGAGAEVHYDTVVREVIQAPAENGTADRVEGVRAIREGNPVEYRAEVTLDCAGALSILQDEADLREATFDTNVSYQQFCSAYREIIHVEEPVSWADALVFKPTERAAGYLWYFPRTDTEINAGLGFQMTEEPMALVDDLKRDLRTRPEFDGAEVADKLGAALPTRRPYDSAVAPGFLAAGDAAGHVNPTTGGGIAGAAYAGHYAAEAAIDAVGDGPPSERALWEYNERVMDHFGARYAALDVYNVLSTAVDTDELMGLLAALPGERIAESLYEGSTSLGLRDVVQIATSSAEYWREVLQFYRTKRRAEDLLDHYEAYPDSPRGFERWQQVRDRLMDEVYAVTGADPKY
jgi:geranylgeranyl reductase family protein